MKYATKINLDYLIYQYKKYFHIRFSGELHVVVEKSRTAGRSEGNFAQKNIYFLETIIILIQCFFSFLFTRYFCISMFT